MTTPPGDQPPYGARPPSGEQPYPQYGYGYPAAPQDHPKASTSMVLGILGLVMCQIAAPFAWSIGKRTLAEIDASGGRLGGRSQAQAGYILGIIGTALLGLALAFLLIYFVVFLVVLGGVAAGA